MNIRPRTIQIYLPSGDPAGIRVAELTTHIVRIFEVPKSQLAKFYEMPDSKQVCLYFLVGDNDELDMPSVYIGQSGAVRQRLTEHENDPTKAFWKRAFVVVSLTNSLTQTHSLFLEWTSIKHVNAAGRYQSKNGNGGSKPYTPAPLEADCLDIFDTTRTLMATLGQPMFEPVAKPKEALSSDDVFYLNGGNYAAVGELTDDGFVVLKGSKGRKEIAPSLQSTSFVKRRQAFLDDDALKEEAGQLIFQRDVLFKTPSGASDIVTGMSTNGWAVWKAASGKTLDELKRQPQQAMLAQAVPVELTEYPKPTCPAVQTSLMPALTPGQAE